MMLTVETSLLVRVAGWSTALAMIGLIAAGITIALFFGGAGAFWGPINDLAAAFTLFAMILPVLAIDRLCGPGAGPWLRIVTVAALAGLVLAAVGQVLLVVGVIDLQTSFVTGGVGIIPFFGWLVALAVVTWGSDPSSVLSPTIAWLAIAVIGLSVAIAVVGSVTTGPILWVVGMALLAALLAWLGTLAGELLRASATA